MLNISNSMLPSGGSAPRRVAAGFSLVEVLVAIVILTIIALSVMSTLVFSSGAARVNGNSLSAKNIAQGYFERMAIDNFNSVNAANYPNITTTSIPAVYLDQGLDIRCGVQIVFKGFGHLTAATATSLTDASASWTNDEWAGDTVFLITMTGFNSTGAGQFATIVSNTATTLNLGAALAATPGAGAPYMINNGKTVQITTTWQYQGKTYSETIASLVANYRNVAPVF